MSSSRTLSVVITGGDCGSIADSFPGGVVGGGTSLARGEGF